MVSATTLASSTCERENITFMMELRDEKVEKEMKDKEKQSRIEFLVKRYEDANGTMTPEISQLL